MFSVAWRVHCTQFIFLFFYDFELYVSTFICCFYSLGYFIECAMRIFNIWFFMFAGFDLFFYFRTNKSKEITEVQIIPIQILPSRNNYSCSEERNCLSEIWKTISLLLSLYNLSYSFCELYLLEWFLGKNKCHFIISHCDILKLSICHVKATYVIVTSFNFKKCHFEIWLLSLWLLTVVPVTVTVLLLSFYHLLTVKFFLTDSVTCESSDSLLLWCHIEFWQSV